MNDNEAKTLAQIEKEAFTNALVRNKFNISATARELDVSRVVIYNKIVEHMIEKPETVVVSDEVVN